jgi:hypothetical protein
MIHDKLTAFAGKPVVEWEEGTALKDAAATIYRISLDYDEHEKGMTWCDKFSSFLKDPSIQQITGLVVGEWGEAFTESSAPIVEAIVSAREQLPNLTAIFLGDMTYEQCEISWIIQSDLSPIFNAYPNLEYFGARGARQLTLGSLHLEKLKHLVIESGGLPVEVVRNICAAQLPALEHLELWLGTDEYGADAAAEDFEPILSGKLFPKLQYLGLRDSYIADQIAMALAKAPIVDRIKVLDLSLGTLGDKGVKALLKNPALKKLQKLDIHHHYCSDEMIEKLNHLGIEVDVSDQEENEGEDERYVAVGE